MWGGGPCEEESRVFQQDLLRFLGMGQGVRTGLNRESATELGMGLGTGYKGKEGE